MLLTCYYLSILFFLTSNSLGVQVKWYVTKKNHLKLCSQNYEGHCCIELNICFKWLNHESVHLFTNKLIWKPSNWPSLKKIFLYVCFKSEIETDWSLPLITWYHWNNLCINKCHHIDFFWEVDTRIFIMITNINWLMDWWMGGWKGEGERDRGEEEGEKGNNQNVL